jgi:PTS system nitrogen regulatory IIA component
MPVLRLASHLREDLVFCDLPPLEKRAFIEALASRAAARLPGVDGGDLAARLLARESEQTTGIGHGLALPHATVAGLDDTVIAVGRTKSALDFAALDAEPVDLFFLVLSPPERTGLHLRVLARLARIIDEGPTLARLRATGGAEELYQQLLREDARHA